MKKNGVETGTRVSGSLIFCALNGEREEERKRVKDNRGIEKKREKERGREERREGARKRKRD